MKGVKLISAALTLSIMLALFGNLGTYAATVAFDMPKADGKVTFTDKNATIDASNSDQGYVMAKYTGSSTNKLKVQVVGPSGTSYTYNLNTKGNYEVFPLSEGSGDYKVGVLQNTTDNKYALLVGTTLKAALADEFRPFLLPNQYVDYKEGSKVVAKGAELVKDKKTDLDKIASVYEFVIKNFTYDKQKANDVKTGYLPDVDKVLEEKKGICFDYAAVMASMLRSQKIPTKLVVGYANKVYHAWLDVYTKENGWIQSVIFFDGKTWRIMDPTFASTSNSSEKVEELIGDGSNYTTMYLY